MKYVCILQSVTAHDHFYTGIADDLDATLSKHNLGEVVLGEVVAHASKYRPWRTRRTYRSSMGIARWHLRSI
jgi:hypothetical protein